jgi:hypothetical protein
MVLLTAYAINNVHLMLPSGIGANVFAHNASYNPTGPVGALAYWTANAIKTRYVKNPGPLVSA